MEPVGQARRRLADAWGGTAPRQASLGDIVAAIADMAYQYSIDGRLDRRVTDLDLDDLLDWPPPGQARTVLPAWWPVWMPKLRTYDPPGDEA